MPVTSSRAAVSPSERSPYLPVALAWLIPGAGHFLLGRRWRAAIIFFSVTLMFVIGLLMRGPLFKIGGADLLSRLIQFGGFLGDLACGFLYFLTVWLGYAAPDIAGHNPDYGSKFLVAAGLLNVLAMVDVYEIATKQKE
ncbi:MAG: hypothetical protein JOY62_08840 [Acidobacteriaceae bacterium]|nr:hypothetical protein [Acidobacteriaceae bacterium]MBV9780066.1 hypothetical protein [Acidobacteriaceae bacterium]